MRLRSALTLSLVLFAPVLGANTITVNGLGDSLATDGVCTLREAVLNANNNAATYPDCAAGAGADVINLPAGTITMAIGGVQEDAGLTGDIDVHDSVTISGNAAGTTIDINGKERAFDFNGTVFLPPAPDNPIVVALNNLNIINGSAIGDGGGIQVFRFVTATFTNVTISNCVTNNDAGGLNIYSDSNVTLINCTISGNHNPWLAAGIKNDSQLTMIGCTVTGNYTTGGTPTRGQGIGGYGVPVILKNTLIAGNGSGPGQPDTEGGFNSMGYNIIGNFDPMINTVTATTGDQFGVSMAAINLGVLANNGGPVKTHALNPGSVAIDKGDSFGVTTDARGETRPCDQPSIANATGGDGADIGAFEVQGTCATPNTAPDAVDDNASVNQDSGANTINVLANDTDADGDALTITAVTQGAHGSVANNGTNVSYTPNPSYIGSDSFTYTIDDGHGGSDTATVSVTVKDTQPPSITVSVATGLLWPPNHDLINVGFSATATDNGSGPITVSYAVYSDEDDVTSADGDQSPDAKNVAPSTLRLRAERDATSDGRVYLIIVTATDASSNTSRKCVAAVVPKNQSAASVAAVNAQIPSACQTAGLFLVGDGPVVGPKQ